MLIFRKTVKNLLSVGGPAPEPPFASGGLGHRPPTPAMKLLPTITALASSLLGVNAFYYPTKKNKIITVNVLFLLLPPLFTYFSLQTLYFC